MSEVVSELKINVLIVNEPELRKYMRISADV